MATNNSTPDQDLGRYFAEGPSDGSPDELDDGALDIGRRISHARDAVGMTRNELAAHLGVKESTITKWESGERSPRGQRVSKLAGILGVSLSWILVGRGIEPSRAAHLEVAQIRTDLRRTRERLSDVVAALNAIDARLAALDER